MSGHHVYKLWPHAVKSLFTQMPDPSSLPLPPPPPPPSLSLPVITPDHLLWGTFGLPLLTVTVPPREKETAHMNPMIGLHTSNHAHITQQGPLYPYI